MCRTCTVLASKKEKTQKRKKCIEREHRERQPWKQRDAHCLDSDLRTQPFSYKGRNEVAVNACAVNAWAL